MKKCSLFIILICQLCFVKAQNTIDITYLANEGFLISAGTSKILIDGIFTEGWGNYHVPTSEILQKEQDAEFPFDSIDVILVTHNHADHINPDYTAEHLSNNESAFIAGPPQVKQLLETTGPYSAISSRIISVNPAANSRIDTVIKGIVFSVIALKHPDDAGNTIQNLAFLFTINGFTIFHLGDTDPANLGFFQSLNLASDSIDIAFVPRWFYSDEYGDMGREIIRYLKPKANIPMHLKTNTYDYFKDMVSIIHGIHPIYFMETPMKKLSFTMVNDTVTTFLDSKYAYFGLAPPGDSAVLFAPGTISLTNRYEAKITFSSNGKDIYFGTINPDDFSGLIFQSQYNNGTWSNPEEISFSNVQSAYYPTVSMDGSRLYFEMDSDIWMTEHNDTGWGEPQSFPAPINSEALEECATISSDGTLYFHSRRDGGFGTYGDIWRFRPGSEQAENLGPIINSTNWQSHPCIAPDQSYLIFARNNESNDLTELYISFATDNEEWTIPINMNEGGCKINTNNTDHPSLSPDGKYFFFSPHDMTKSDIYWVSTSIIDTLKKIVFQPSGVGVKETENQVSVFPNPVDGVFTITLATEPIKNATAEIYNTDGKMVLQQTLHSPNSTINLSGYAAGMYFLIVNTGLAKINKKIIKQ